MAHDPLTMAHARLHLFPWHDCGAKPGGGAWWRAFRRCLTLQTHSAPPLDADLADLGALELAQRGLLPYGGTAIEDFLRAARVDGELFRTRRAAIHNGYMAAAAASASTATLAFFGLGTRTST